MTVLEDPTGRIANWDQRGAIAPDGRLVTFTWTYDFETATLPQRPAPDQRGRRRAVRPGRGSRVRRPAGASGGAAGRACRPRLGRPVRDGQHPGAPGGRDRRAVRRRRRRWSSTGPATAVSGSATGPADRRGAGRRRRRPARPSSTWAPGRTASPMPRRCPTATSASSTTRRAPTAARTSAGPVSGSTR